MPDLFAGELERLRAACLDRHLREIRGTQGVEIEMSGRRVINFSSNDYLGLANDSRMHEAAIAAINEFGVGAGASRLISGSKPQSVIFDAFDSISIIRICFDIRISNFEFAI